MNTIREDLKLLFEHLVEYRTTGYINADDGEFKELWKSYDDVRTELIKLNPDIFGKLRSITLPEPDKSNQNYDECGGVYYEEHILPLFREVEKAIEYFASYKKTQKSKEFISDPINILNRLSKSFLSVSRQLNERYNGRETLTINDEYDVQDLFHALLKIFFDDIRPEECTQSYAGSSSRMDFLLKNEKLVVEIKKNKKRTW